MDTHTDNDTDNDTDTNRDTRTDTDTDIDTNTGIDTDTDLRQPTVVHVTDSSVVGHGAHVPLHMYVCVGAHVCCTCMCVLGHMFRNIVAVPYLQSSPILLDLYLGTSFRSGEGSG